MYPGFRLTKLGRQSLAAAYKHYLVNLFYDVLGLCEMPLRVKHNGGEIQIKVIVGATWERD